MDKKQLIEFKKARSVVYKAARVKECIFQGIPGAKCKGVVKAHSLQKMGILSRLESEIRGEMGVYTPLEIDPIDDGFWFSIVGKKDASTFFGMCPSHDLACFREIENDTQAISIENDDHLFALNLRAFAVSYHAKKEDVALYSTKDKVVIENGIKYFGDGNLAGRLAMAQISLDEQADEVDMFSKALATRDFSNFDLFAYEFPFEIPFAASMACNPSYLFSGQAINISEHANEPYSSIYSTALPLDGRSIVVLGALKSDPFGSQYLDEISAFKDHQMPSVLSWHFLTNMENLAFNPGWAESLSKVEKESFIATLAKFKSEHTPYEKYKLGRLRLNIFEDYKRVSKMKT